MRGSLFVDYVRMIRSQRDVDWSEHLEPEELAFLALRVVPDDWYPMEIFERLGEVILSQIALGKLEAVRMWGRFSVDALLVLHPDLLAQGDPRDSLMRFQVQRASFFDFEALKVRSVSDGYALIDVTYHMGPVAEEAACWQTMGFVEQLVTSAGGKDVSAKFMSRAWRGDGRSTIELQWE